MCSPIFAVFAFGILLKKGRMSTSSLLISSTRLDKIPRKRLRKSRKLMRSAQKVEKWQSRYRRSAKSSPSLQMACSLVLLNSSPSPSARTRHLSHQSTLAVAALDAECVLRPNERVAGVPPYSALQQAFNRRDRQGGTDKRAPSR